MILDQVFAKAVKEEKVTYKKDTSAEKPLRSMAKSISWRVIGTIDTVLIAWLITGALTLAFSIGAVEFFSKMILYFFHERIWNNIKWGR